MNLWLQAIARVGAQIVFAVVFLLNLAAVVLLFHAASLSAAHVVYSLPLTAEQVPALWAGGFSMGGLLAVGIMRCRAEINELVKLLIKIAEALK